MSTHHHLALASPWKHDPVTKVTAYAPAEANDNPDIASRMRGRAVVSISAGPFDLSLRPTAAELRALAKALTSVAADLDEATAPQLQSKPLPLPPSRRHEAQRAVYPAGLTHLAHLIHQPGAAA